MVVSEAGWAALKWPHTGVWITPLDGSGFVESLYGELSTPFEIIVEESGIAIGDGILGWRGHVVTWGHKYSGMPFEMTPRHTTWTGTVVINVSNGNDYAFSGMADAKGLECDWL
jgi:hypothetical protein